LLDPPTQQIPGLRFATIASNARDAKPSSIFFEPRGDQDEQIFSSNSENLEYDPEKWVPVSRLHEALVSVSSRDSCPAGEARSEKIMPKQ
jgi:hypothetical protein